MKTTTKYAVAYSGCNTGKQFYVTLPPTPATGNIEHAAFDETPALATKRLVASGYRGEKDVRVVAVDITESPETLTELPTLQEGDGVVFAFKVRGGYVSAGRFGLSTKREAYIAKYATQEDALVALQEWALAGAAGGSIWHNGISLVALKRTSSAPTYTVRELK